MKGLSVALLTVLGVSSAHAYTCEDVRALTPSQQAYYIKVFNITPAQQEQIRVACYGGRTHHEALAEGHHRIRAERAAHGERDARTEE